MDLEVTPFQDEKYGEMYNYKTPFELNDVVKLVYEKAKASTRGVFRRWDPDKKMWCGNKLWIDILSKELETMPEPQKKGKFDRSNMPIDAIRGIQATHARTQVGAPIPAYTPEQAVDQLKIAVLNLQRVLDKIDSSVQDQVKESMKKLNMQTNLISATISSASDPESADYI